jgi:tryptophan halogenase
VIVGGGSAGWMTAAGLVGLLGKAAPDIRLIESDEIGIVGVGEATLPQLRAFNRAIGLDERELVAETQASFKLGIQFRNWGEPGFSYIHPFGAFGHPIGGVDFHHVWRRSVDAGNARPLADYSLAISMALAHRFTRPEADPAAILSTFDYAYHFDASLYAALLRRFSEARGVERTEGKIVSVEQAPDGSIAAVRLESGERIEGELFVDCSGFRALLIGDALGAEWEDWSPWLRCDRAWAVPSERSDDLHPYTRVTARPAGWQWRIPLQHRTGNGHVFSSAYMEEEDARDILLANLDAPALAEPRLLRFRAGRRLDGWKANCVSVGLASGFLEPLESTSIYLIQRGVENLVGLLPERDMDPALAAEFNRLMDVEYSRVRDFLILHYHLNCREEPLWRDCAAMEVPESLARKLALFRHSGRVETYRDGLFSPPSWISVFLGQGIMPDAPHPLAEAIEGDGIDADLDNIATAIEQAIAPLPSHAEALAAMAAAREAA